MGIVDASHTPAFADYDGDGDLDLFVLTNRYEDGEGYRGNEALAWDAEGRPTVKPEFEKYYKAWYLDENNWGVNSWGRADYLLRNDGGKFTDVSEAAGIMGRGDGLSATWWDYNSDGKADLYVGNDFISPDKLYRNNGDGTFTDVIGEIVPHTSWFTMGVDAGDLDGDGRPELLAADMSATNHFKQKTTMGVMGGAILKRANGANPPQLMRNALLVNNGAGRFLEGAFWSQLDSSDWTWAVKFHDLDLDGKLDVFLTNGTPRAMNDSDMTLTPEQLAASHEWEYVKHFPVRREKNMAFRNAGELAFENVAELWGLGDLGVSYGAAAGDLDRDGDVDLVVLNVEDELSVFENGSQESGRVVVRLNGVESNRNGTGARVEISAGGQLMVREIYPDRGFLGGDEPVALVGLGGAETIETMVVRWPSGKVQRFEGLEAGWEYTVTEGGEAGESAYPPVEKTLFREAEGQEFVGHEDPYYDDFTHQSLLPNRLSALGPGVAWGDVDGDGDDDLFTGGGAGSAGVLMVNGGGGNLERVAVEAFGADAGCEDMGAVFFDVDSDGDLDLYVASGSYEFAPDDPLLGDRLYVNDGSGGFVRSDEGALPGVLTGSGVVTAADFDGDGDVDLFCGGRVTPREYPVVPRSVLLRNDSTPGGAPVLTDVADDVAPGLSAIGMVTSALWSDADGDGASDLLVACEWGAVSVFLNRGEKLENVTEGSGLEDMLGWWSSLSGGDVDGDGDVDYIAGNQGLNTKYHASAEAPVKLFYGDYGETGERRLVEAEFEDGVLYPVRGKSCSTRAMPHLADKFSTFRGFAQASLVEIYEPEKLDGSIELEVNTLESVLLLNEGGGKFSVRKLPRLAQISPVFGSVVRDFDGDGSADVLLVQNFYGAQSETGRFDGGLGLFLQGRGDGSFEALDPGESGVVVPGDATALATVDLDGNGRPDWVVARNGEVPLMFMNAAEAGGGLAVRLSGGKGNPAGVGAVVSAVVDGSEQRAEIYAGEGYLGQSSPTVYFGLGEQVAGEVEVVVRWADGEETKRLVTLPVAGPVVVERAE